MFSKSKNYSTEMITTEEQRREKDERLKILNRRKKCTSVVTIFGLAVCIIALILTTYGTGCTWFYWYTICYDYSTNLTFAIVGMILTVAGILAVFGSGYILKSISSESRSLNNRVLVTNTETIVIPVDHHTSSTAYTIPTTVISESAANMQQQYFQQSPDPQQGEARGGYQ